MGFERTSGLLRAVAKRFGEYRRTHVEMYERHFILMEPWTHDVLHWGADGTLHGSIVVDRARTPVTRGGWCPCRPFDAEVTVRRDPSGSLDPCPEQ
ncbi:putative protein OS=Tsukamurella paurometabola (strain ATCC 8368 / DSM / CCUG 35730 /CIP 100753 / JCM 10117 / KCTC 9821 / NBRC 16120 / NCIMB 702349/ NCTC 13040) OX=521096 GN=Tpau_0808 PE=4 SV=1 [Tsukamurella paurometabola]|uniref:Uncharacterized protein n=1 Tax=Tsukamurella paurometabola (strain ATCC 8368 / DSM 20162 / CCUG 35730 / CIP 100753 / JCM 10117 / KCTC 9821 / NBRC 16120 / NCIMB 702349 / NCTC 13040) TaxID=521096 RepID=D5UTU0_TSUPD|nr:hypothetical protein [Tsukamurella paurometabola]ADG77444.1 hypothetical protein Tpau_0808 [Tsukamurella paurometabola DSM 20162]SUP27071.1 Uncharacterised protein [Tsukamurella paurometabola]